MTSSSIVAAGTTDDIRVLFDEDEPDALPTRKREVLPWRRARWGVVLLPWVWFLIRGFHPWLEVVAILLPALVLASVIPTLFWAAFSRSWLSLAVACSALTMLAVAVFLPRSPVTSGAPVDATRLLSINVADRWFSHNDLAFLVFENEPDLVIGTELSPSHDEELRKVYDFAIADLEGLDPDPDPESPVEQTGTYRENDVPSIGVYTNLDLEVLEDPLADQIAGGLPGIRARVGLPEGDVVLYALHIPRPGTGSGFYEVGPRTQRTIVSAIADAVSQEELPVIVMGDLNIVDRGASYGELTDHLWDAMRIDNWTESTREGDAWHTLLQLRVDHLLISSELCAMDATADSVFFTDHRTIQADVGPCES